MARRRRPAWAVADGEEARNWPGAEMCRAPLWNRLEDEAQFRNEPDGGNGLTR